MSRAQAHTPVSAAERAALDRAADSARQRTLYGEAVEDVAYLRQRGFVVTREGEGVRVGNRLVSLEEVPALAARERNVAGEGEPSVLRRPAETTNGLKVGQVVALAPKAPKPVRLVERQPMRDGRKPGGAVARSIERAAEHSTELGVRPRVVWLDLDLLVVDGNYQRSVTEAGRAHINRLRREWNWNCYQPIIVSERPDGSHAVIDGQHRLLAAKSHPLIDELPCYIVDAPDIAAQAAIFVEVNSRRLALTSQQKFWAAHAAGDAAAVAIEKLCRRAGVTILRNVPPYGITPPCSMLGPFTLRKLHKSPGAAPLATALGLIAETHPETSNAFRSAIVVGLTRVAAATPFSRLRMATTLKGLDLDKLYEAAKADRVTGGGLARAGDGALAAGPLRAE